MTAAEIEKLKALEREATPGPWGWVGAGIQPLYGGHRNDHILWPANSVTPEQPLSEDTYREWWPQALGACGLSAEPNAPGNAMLLTAARNALPRLLEERERLLEALRGMRDQFDGMRDFVCPDGGAESVAAATDAIAFAEAPATGSKEV